MPAPLSKIVDYPAFLNEAWEHHLEPRSATSPTVISTFAGCGGSSLGYSMAGFSERLAVEWDANAIENFRANFPEVPLFEGDIARLTDTELFKRTGLLEGELDVFDGSPPCQGFSTSGRRMLDDRRNYLFLEYVRLLKALRPKVFVMENVTGMVKGKMKLIFASILRELRACGYRVKAIVMQAKYFGVPQSRERMIFLGTRNDLGIDPSLPAAIYRPVTLREAVGDIASVGVELTGELAEVGRSARPDEDFRTTRKRLGLKGEKYFSTKKLSWERPCMTITKTMIPAMSGLVHPDRNNMLSIAALKRCGSFPDPFQLIGSETDQWARIGNSVPPMMMFAIAKHIREEILKK